MFPKKFCIKKKVIHGKSGMALMSVYVCVKQERCLKTVNSMFTLMEFQVLLFPDVGFFLCRDGSGNQTQSLERASKNKLRNLGLMLKAFMSRKMAPEECFRKLKVEIYQDLALGLRQSCMLGRADLARKLHLGQARLWAGGEVAGYIRGPRWPGSGGSGTMAGSCS